MVTLTPEMVAPVCHVGDPLNITCIASAEFIRWNVFQPNEQDTLVEAINAVQLNSRDPSQTKRGEVNSATFTFIRRSGRGASPLISTVSIDSVSTGLNGTVVRCTDVENPLMSASTTIQIIDIRQSKIVLIASMKNSLFTSITNFLHMNRHPIYSCTKHFTRNIWAR